MCDHRIFSTSGDDIDRVIRITYVDRHIAVLCPSYSAHLCVVALAATSLGELGGGPRYTLWHRLYNVRRIDVPLLAGKLHQLTSNGHLSCLLKYSSLTL